LIYYITIYYNEHTLYTRTYLLNTCHHFLNNWRLLQTKPWGFHYERFMDYPMDLSIELPMS